MSHSLATSITGFWCLDYEIDTLKSPNYEIWSAKYDKKALIMKYEVLNMTKKS